LNQKKATNVVGTFEKVTLTQFSKDWVHTFPVSENEVIPVAQVIDVVNDIYNKITVPVRATKYSAGYDFVTPIDIKLEPGATIKFPTGIKAKITDPAWCLLIMPRSSLGFKYRLMLDNTVGLIDADYQNSDNEGHIFVKLTNCGNKTVEVKAGDRIVQGVFVQYGITADDKVNDERNGGFGSTGK
jgi:dUTP pyrophosphatase